MNSDSERILQFGAGRFLRGFADRFIQEANDAGRDVGKVVVVQSTAGKRAQLLRDQPDGFQVLVRGVQDGETIDRLQRVRSISRALSAVESWPEVLAFAKSPALETIISNATEAGYVLDDADAFDASPPSTLAAKLARLLFERYQAGGSPLTLLPCELIEQNATKLRDLVTTQATRWNLSAAYLEWLRDGCVWLNNLVDCIITDGAEDHPLGKEDPLLISAEPYRLWAIEKPKGRDVKVIPHEDIHLVDDLSPYYLRKVRILNGTHTAMTARFLPEGFETVLQVVTDRRAARWVRDVMYEEIVPTLLADVSDVAAFADATFDRYRNPFLKHLLKNITLNHDDKVRVRLHPTRDLYQKLYGRPPEKISSILDWRP